MKFWMNWKSEWISARPFLVVGRVSLVHVDRIVRAIAVVLATGYDTQTVTLCIVDCIDLLMFRSSSGSVETLVLHLSWFYVTVAPSPPPPPPVFKS